MQLRHSQPILLFFLGCLFAFALTSCTKQETRSLDIPAGFATQTLKEFARQAKVEIIFDPQSVYGVKTQSVKGDYEPQAALRIMLKDTPLSVDFDDESGAYAIIRIELSFNAHGTPFINTIGGASYVQFSVSNSQMIKKNNFF